MSQPSVRKIKTVNWLRLYHKLTFIFVIINDFITLNNFFDTLLFVKIVSELKRFKTTVLMKNVICLSIH